MRRAKNCGSHVGMSSAFTEQMRVLALQEYEAELAGEADRANFLLEEAARLAHHHGIGSPVNMRLFLRSFWR
jgi:hypothetical protein